MKVGLFASRDVGREVAAVFAERRYPLACLALDAAEGAEGRAALRELAGVREDRVLLSDRLYAPETLATLEALELDLVILAWWPYILKQPLVTLPRLGCLNFHPSYLPHNRGKHYNFWAIVEEAPFGVTLHHVDEGVDRGDIAFQARIETGWEDTGETLYRKAQVAIVRLFREAFDDIVSGNIPRTPQDPGAGSFHLARELEPASRIDLDEPCTARHLLNVLRARTFPPHPAAWFEADGQKYEVRVQINRANPTNEVR